MNKLRYLPSAEDDLTDIFYYISRENVDAAHRTIERIRSAVTRLRDYPRSAPPRLTSSSGLRGLTVGSYIVYYRITRAGVDVIRVLHAARDPRRAGLPDQP
jgi:toxin ParE1/3/4